MTELPNALEVIEKLRKNAHLGKHKHFFASSRGRRLHISFGVPIVVINVILSSTFFLLLSKDIPTGAKWAGAICALAAAALGAIQTFFRFHKASESHRTVGNQYLNIARACEKTMADYFDGLLPLQQLSVKLDELNTRYQEVNTAAEALPTSQRDYEQADAVERKKEAEQMSLVQRAKHRSALHKSVDGDGAKKLPTAR